VGQSAGYRNVIVSQLADLKHEVAPLQAGRNLGSPDEQRNSAINPADDCIGVAQGLRRATASATLRTSRSRYPPSYRASAFAQIRAPRSTRPRLTQGTISNRVDRHQIALVFFHEHLVGQLSNPSLSLELVLSAPKTQTAAAIPECGSAFDLPSRQWCRPASGRQGAGSS
jgi:hypothetical protein